MVLKVKNKKSVKYKKNTNLTSLNLFQCLKSFKILIDLIMLYIIINKLNSSEKYRNKIKKKKIKVKIK